MYIVYRYRICDLYTYIFGANICVCTYMCIVSIDTCIGQFLFILDVTYIYLYWWCPYICTIYVLYLYNICVYLYICVQYMCVYIYFIFVQYMCVCIYMHNIYIFIYTYICIYIHVCMYSFDHENVLSMYDICVYVCTCTIYIYLYKYVYVHIYICIQFRP